MLYFGGWTAQKKLPYEKKLLLLYRMKIARASLTLVVMLIIECGLHASEMSRDAKFASFPIENSACTGEPHAPRANAFHLRSRRRHFRHRRFRLGR